MQILVDNTESEIDDVTGESDLTYNGINEAQSTPGIIDITEEQNQMKKRFDQIKFTHTDEACIDLFHIMKT